jgi:hypothetical protein
MTKAKSLLLVFLTAAFWNAEAFITRSPSLLSRVTDATTIRSPFAPRHKDHSLGPLRLANDVSSDDEERSKVKVDSVVKETSLLLRRLSWFAWWAQLILSTISSVTLLFARNVMKQSNGSISVPNFVLAGTGIIFAYGSVFWTWATRRLSRRLLKKPTTRVQAANMVRKIINVGVTINILGMLVTIIGAQQITGVLAIKVLTTSRSLTMLESSSLLQPLDILVVQANTNTLLSHFLSIAALLYASKSLLKLDPPSIEGDERRR